MHDEWVESVLPRYQTLTRTLCSLLEGLLEKRSIEFLSVEGRTKDKDGILEKIVRKKYEKPAEQLTDISGIRIVTFLTSGANDACSLIREFFDVDEPNSLDKSALLDVDQIGYRSVHFVCCLSSDRLALPEFEDFGDLKFEVQVRTVLQHAWAELSHDRSYKFSGKLPAMVERKMNLYAGMLELADTGFQDLSDQIDEYSVSVTTRTASGDLDIEINSTSLRQYLGAKAKELGETTLSDQQLPESLIEELTRFRIRTLHDLDKLFNNEFISAFSNKGTFETLSGLCRDLMIYSDITRYFEESYTGWKILPDRDFAVPRTKYSEDEIQRILSRVLSDENEDE